MNLWEQYNPGCSLGTVVSASSGVALDPVEDRAVFETLKRHLTRRELRAFVMNAAGIETSAIAKATGLDASATLQTLARAQQKFKQPKMQTALRGLAAAREGA